MSLYQSNNSYSNYSNTSSRFSDDFNCPPDLYGRFTTDEGSWRRVSLDQESSISSLGREGRDFSYYGSVDSEVTTQATSRSEHAIDIMGNDDRQSAELSNLRVERTIKFVNGIVSGVGVALVSVPAKAISSAASWGAWSVETSAALGLYSSGWGIAGAALFSAGSLALGAALGAARGFCHGLNAAYKGHQQGLTALWDGISNSLANAAAACSRAR